MLGRSRRCTPTCRTNSRQRSPVVASTFAAELWAWDARRSDTWLFVTLPTQLSEEIRAEFGHQRAFGSVKVQVDLGSVQWRTSVFPDKKSGCYVLPVKASVRRATGLTVGDVIEVSVTVLG